MCGYWKACYWSCANNRFLYWVDSSSTQFNSPRFDAFRLRQKASTPRAHRACSSYTYLVAGKGYKSRGGFVARAFWREYAHDITPPNARATKPPRDFPPLNTCGMRGPCACGYVIFIFHFPFEIENEYGQLFFILFFKWKIEITVRTRTLHVWERVTSHAEVLSHFCGVTSWRRCRGFVARLCPYSECHILWIRTQTSTYWASSSCGSKDQPTGFGLC